MPDCQRSLPSDPGAHTIGTPLTVIPAAPGVLQKDPGCTVPPDCSGGAGGDGVYSGAGGGGVYSGAGGGGVYSGVCARVGGVHGAPHNLSPSAPIDSLQAASLQENSRDAALVGVGVNSDVRSDVPGACEAGTVLVTGGDVVVWGAVALAEGVTESDVRVGSESEFRVSSSPKIAPNAMSPRRTTATIHGHFRCFFPLPRDGSPP